MYKHYLLILEDYADDDRIAYHTVISSQKGFDIVKKYEHELEQLEVEFYTHLITTLHESIESVRTKDAFFSDIHFFEQFTEFKKMAASSAGINAFDISRYILMIQPMTPLKLQKVLYIVYERYFLETGKKLFQEQFLAFEYGPVVEEVYEEYKGRRDLLLVEDGKTVYSVFEKATTPITFKIFKEQDREYISRLIKKVVEEYKNNTAWEMVEKTHENGTAWYTAYRSGRNTEITEYLIKTSQPVK